MEPANFPLRWDRRIMETASRPPTPAFLSHTKWSLFHEESVAHFSCVLFRTFLPTHLSRNHLARDSHQPYTEHCRLVHHVSRSHLCRSLWHCARASGRLALRQGVETSFLDRIEKMKTATFRQNNEKKRLLEFQEQVVEFSYFFRHENGVWVLFGYKQKDS